MGALNGLHTGVSDLLASAWGEEVVYTPKGGSPATITAVVTRDAPRAFGPSANSQLAYPLLIQVRKADVATVTCRADTVAIKRRSGDATATTYYVTEIVSQSGAMWSLAVSA